jgi:predicted metal-dependent phosphoesterase TrpH
MPAGQPFTRLCQQLSQLRAEAQRADLHIHTTHSDGRFTPAEVVCRAKERGLGAIAITDHDTCAGLPEARAAAATFESAPEIITGVEITCDYRDGVLHLLGYFFDANDECLSAALAEMRSRRRERFAAMLARLPALGLTIPGSDIRELISREHSLGRPDLAALLVKHGHAPTAADAFARYLHDGGPLFVPMRGLPVADAVALVRNASGISSWAHPPETADLRDVDELRGFGLDALEAAHPAFTAARERNTRALARAAGLAVTAGSDNHGPFPASRTIGSLGVRKPELEALRNLANSRQIHHSGLASPS